MKKNKAVKIFVEIFIKLDKIIIKDTFIPSNTKPIRW